MYKNNVQIGSVFSVHHGLIFVNENDVLDELVGYVLQNYNI